VVPCRIQRTISLSSRAKGEHILVPVAVDVTGEVIAKFAKKMKVTPATIFQAAWVHVLRHFAKTDDVLFGYVTVGRELAIPGVEELVGPMINMLACRIGVDGETSKAQLWKRTHDSFLETLQHQHGFVAAAQAIETSAGSLPFNSVLSIEYCRRE
jgi:non-ribosomal peptide synthetase component F